MRRRRHEVLGAYGRAIAVRQTPTTGPMTLSYLLADHLGSTVGAIDSVTGAGSRQAYWPYGATRSTSGALTTDKLYTGQQQEATGALQDATVALGLYFYHARFYSTTTGRFVSPDSSTVDGLNRFAYVRANPMRYSDPTGHCIRWGGKILPCEEKDAKNFIACAFGSGGMCTADTAADKNLRRLSWFALRDATFFASVKFLVAVRPAFYFDVLNIRMYNVGRRQAEISESWSNLYAVPDGGFNQETGRGSGAVDVSVDISYFDVHVVARLSGSNLSSGRPLYLLQILLSGKGTSSADLVSSIAQEGTSVEARLFDSPFAPRTRIDVLVKLRVNRADLFLPACGELCFTHGTSDLRWNLMDLFAKTALGPGDEP